jgi:hypothetical protein
MMLNTSALGNSDLSAISLLAAPFTSSDSSTCYWRRHTRQQAFARCEVSCLYACLFSSCVACKVQVGSSAHLCCTVHSRCASRVPTCNHNQSSSPPPSTNFAKHHPLGTFNHWQCTSLPTTALENPQQNPTKPNKTQQNPSLADRDSSPSQLPSSCEG